MSFFNADIRVTGTDGLILKDLGSSATTPSSGFGSIFVNGDIIYFVNDGGTSTSLLQSADIVSDTSPQLGGNLDVNGNDITSASGGDIELDPNGSGVVIFKGNSTKGAGQFKLNCEFNSHGITIKGPPHSAGASYTLTLPNDDGDADQVLRTNGSGVLSWVAQSSGGGGSSAADDITIGDSTVNISTTSGSIIMHSVNNASNSIVMTSNSGANETIEIHNIKGTDSSAILLKSHQGGISIEGKSTNKDNVSNVLSISSSVPTSNGSGFNPKYFNSFTNKAFGTTITTFQIDTENLLITNNNNSNKIIGTNNSTNAFFGRYNSSTMGEAHKLEFICVENNLPIFTTTEEIGFARNDGSGNYTTWDLSNGTIYSAASLYGSGSGAKLTFDMTSSGFIKEVFLHDQGINYTNFDDLRIQSDGGVNYDNFVHMINGSDKRVIVDNNFYSSSSNPTNVNLSYISSGSGIGKTANIKNIDIFGSYYAYGISTNTNGSGYVEGDILYDNNRIYIGVTGSSTVNGFGLGASSSILSTGDTVTSLFDSTNSVTGKGFIGLANAAILTNNDYLYLTMKGSISSNSTITSGKYLIKLYGTDF